VLHFTKRQTTITKKLLRIRKCHTATANSTFNNYYTPVIRTSFTRYMMSKRI